ncbi:hypothetical protein LSL4_gp135 [Pseudomonas phage LSL4]|nr:hypothetical protein LSL4_gp135 [Pseudomonas phage LSL4]
MRAPRGPIGEGVGKCPLPVSKPYQLDSSSPFQQASTKPYNHQSYHQSCAEHPGRMIKPLVSPLCQEFCNIH